MTTGMVQDQNLEKHIEKQMGCMAGFLQIFDRHQILSGKRLYSTKRLPPVHAQAVDTEPESESTTGSPAISKELEKQQRTRSNASPDRSKQSPTLTVPESSPETPSQPTKSPLTLPVFEFKEGTRSSWKFSREAPRLSLDSRATVDAKGSLYPKEIRTNAAILSSANRCDSSAVGDENDKQRCSPSVIARLMGLEPLPHSSDPEPVKNAELRRSASESRVSRDLYQYRFIDGNAFHLKHQCQQQPNISSNVITDNAANEDHHRAYNARPVVDPKGYVAKGEAPKLYHRGIGQRKSFFNSADFFPDPKQTVSVYGEIEKRLKMRGIDEPSKDLETLKQILEALQLKGLLHSKKPSNLDYRNFVYDRNFSHDNESPIVLMKPSRSAVRMSRPSPRMVGGESPPPSRPSNRRNQNLGGDTMAAVSPRRDRPEIDRIIRYQCRGRTSSPPSNRFENSIRSPNRRRPLSVETQQRKSNTEFVEQRRVSPVSSPKVNSRRIISSRSPTNRRRTAEAFSKDEKVFPHAAEDESSTTISESSISTSSQTDTERSKVEEYKESRSLLERCDKLLHSIAEITANTELQPSPVSVLDSSFYKEESSPSPVLKRSIDFKDQPLEYEDESWNPAISPVQSSSKFNESDDCDLVYITEILRASDYLPEESDVFQLLEKHQYREGKDTSKASRLQRRLIFDTINEIRNRNRELPPWKVASWSNSAADRTSVRQIWLEFRRIRERDESEDLFEVICGVLRKDLAGDAIHGWEDCPIEMSESVLDIERLIFKDLIGETIRELAFSAAKFTKLSAPCRKLVF